MKITQSRPVTSSSRRGGVARSAGRSGEAFARHVETEAPRPSGLGPSVPLSSLDAVLAVHEVGDATGERRLAISRAHGLLDELHELRIGLIDGWVSEAQLRRLADTLAVVRAPIEDPGLESVLEEVEVRAAVELAKRGRDPS